MNRNTVQERRESYRAAEDELTKASHLHAAVHEFSERRGRGAVGDVEDVTEAFQTFLRPGPGQTVADRRGDLAYLIEGHVPTEGGGPTDFFTAAGQYAGSKRAGGTSLQSLVDDLQGFVTAASAGGSTDPSDAVATFDALAVSGSGPMADHLATVTGLLVTAAEGKRDTIADDLNNDYSLDSSGRTIEDEGAIQQYIESVDDTVAELSDEQPLALLPVRLETRFIGPEREAVGNSHELWVRMYPDRIHNDAHEEHLTDVEVRWGRNFWASLWVATHETITDDEIDRAYLRTHLPAAIEDGTIGTLLELDPASFPTDTNERKDAIKERVWNQLLERFDRERAAYVVHECKPDNWETIVDTEAVFENADVPRKTLPQSGDERELRFPSVDRKAESWTRGPQARLLPDRWILFGIWEHEGEDLRETFVLRSDAIREPLPVGPTPEAMAVAEQYGSDTPGGADRGSGADSAVGTDADIAWITEFGAAEKAGMAVRIRDADVFGGPTPPGIDDLADGTFRKLIVTGVSASMSADETAEELERLFDAHHYTDGLELVEQGTPTNNYDTDSGYSSTDDARESMAVECSTPVIEHGENTDGDMLARALGIDPVTAGSDEHVFAHVENADADYQTRAWHANSALWSGTLGYYFQNMLSDGALPEPLADGELQWSGIVPEANLRGYAGLYESYRRHFINYVRAQGPLPAFRADTQPYGVMPAMPMADDRTNPITDDQDPSMGDPSRPGDDPPGSGTDLGDGTDIAGSGVVDEATSDANGGGTIDPRTWEAGASIDADNGESLAEIWESTSSESFRESYSVREAHGRISDARLAATYPPEEAAKAFTKREMASHYDPIDAATVLSAEELTNYYEASTLSDAAVDESDEEPDRRGA